MINNTLTLLFFFPTLPFLYLFIWKLSSTDVACYGLMDAKLQLQTSWGQDPLLKLFVISSSVIYSRTVLQPLKVLRDKVKKVGKEKSHPKRDSKIWKCFSASVLSLKEQSDFRIACSFLSGCQSWNPYHFNLSFWIFSLLLKVLFVSGFLCALFLFVVAGWLIPV